MNPQFFGDSYDVVKRFFIEQVRAAGFSVAIEPMFTGTWGELEQGYFNFLKVSPMAGAEMNGSALFLDPDTGIGSKRTKRHLTIGDFDEYLMRYEVVFAFDQSFSRSTPIENQIQNKLQMLEQTGSHGFYYNSHACFLYVAKSMKTLNTIEQQILSTGMPSNRILKSYS